MSLLNARHTLAVLDDVLDERERDDRRLDKPINLPDFVTSGDWDSWTKDLSRDFSGVALCIEQRLSKGALRKNLVELAATAVQWIEQLDREAGTAPPFEPKSPPCYYCTRIFCGTAHPGVPKLDDFKCRSCRNIRDNFAPREPPTHPDDVHPDCALHLHE